MPSEKLPQSGHEVRAQRVRAVSIEPYHGGFKPAHSDRPLLRARVVQTLSGPQVLRVLRSNKLSANDRHNSPFVISMWTDDGN